MTFGKPEAKTRIARARTGLLLAGSYWGPLALRLAPEENQQIETMATDGARLLYNPVFVDELTDENLTAVIVHETAHCIFGHPWRLGDRDMHKANIAADYAINGIIQADGFKLPDDALLDHQYDGMSFEEIYRGMPDDPEGQDGNQGESTAAGDQQSDAAGNTPAPDGKQDTQQAGNGTPDPGKCGAFTAPAQADANKPDAPTERDWQQAAIQAANLAGIGNTPGAIRDLINAIKHPQATAEQLIAAYLDQFAADDYSMSRPNRAGIPWDIYLPTLETPGAGDIILAADTSGSVNRAKFQELAGFLNDALANIPCERVIVVEFDTSISSVTEFERGQLVDLELYGGGGTDLSAPFRWLESEGITPTVMIVFTDMQWYGFEGLKDPGCPVLWCDWDGRRSDRAPFGEYIDMSGNA